jgi:hypothetical protein
LEDDTQIWQIYGFNMQDVKHRPNDHYFFSHFGFSWGWASGRRAWAYFDVEMKLWPSAKEKNIIDSYPFMPSSLYLARSVIKNIGVSGKGKS